MAKKRYKKPVSLSRTKSGLKTQMNKLGVRTTVRKGGRKKKNRGF